MVITSLNSCILKFCCDILCIFGSYFYKCFANQETPSSQRSGDDCKDVNCSELAWVPASVGRNWIVSRNRRAPTDDFHQVLLVVVLIQGHHDCRVASRAALGDS